MDWLRILEDQTPRDPPGCYASVRVAGHWARWGDQCPEPVRWRGRWQTRDGRWVVVESCDVHWREELWLRRIAGT